MADEHVETNKQRKQAMRNPQSLSFKLWSFPHGYCTNQLVLPGILEKYYLFKTIYTVNAVQKDLKIL